LDDPLLPVRAALLAKAREDAERVLADAKADADAVLAGAAAEAQRIHEVAQAEADRYVAALAAELRARSRRQARAVVLAGQRAAYERLRQRARAAAGQLRYDPDYPKFLAAVTAQVRDRLGADADAREHPDGGVVAEAGGRRLTVTLAGLADRVMDDMGVAVEDLWRP
jgi:cell division septum initiation protein DivIVA